MNTSSDPILDYAPRRHDGRLGLHQWPTGSPVAYAVSGGAGDLCGDCASEFERKGAGFSAWAVAPSASSFLCKGCRRLISHASTDHLSHPILGFAAPDGRLADRIQIQLLDGRLSQIPLESDTQGKYILFVPCHLVYPYFASLTEEGIGPEHRCYEEAMDAITLHSWLRTGIEGARKELGRANPGEAVKVLERLRQLQPRHFETTAVLALALEQAGRKVEAQAEWQNLGESLDIAGYPHEAKRARDGWVLY